MQVGYSNWYDSILNLMEFQTFDQSLRKLKLHMKLISWSHQKMLVTNWKSVFYSKLMVAVLVFASMSLVSCDSGLFQKRKNGTPYTEWRKDYYLPRITYANRCQFPRDEIDPRTNARFPDLRGTMLDEMFYLRSLTRETYLWRDDLTDFDPTPYYRVQGTFATHAVKMDEYFDKLKTNEVTATNNPKDKYHYTQLTTDHVNRTLNRPQPSYGISWVVLSGTVVRNGQSYIRMPRDLRVRYVVPDSPASELVEGVPKVKRGDKVLKVNGIDFITSNSPGLNAVFNAPSGTRTTLVLQDVDTNQEKTVVLVAKDITQKPVNKTSVIEVGADKVGYIHYTTFNTRDSDSSMQTAIKTLKAAGVKDLVLDIRYNGGGYLHVSSMVGFMIAGATNTRNKYFTKLRFYPGAGNRNPVTNRIETPTPFIGHGQPGFGIPTDAPLESLNLNKVYILSTDRTCSASEGLINGLIGADIEVVLIGGRTCGKPYGFYSQDNCGITYSTVQLQLENFKGFGEYADGFVPSTASDGAKVKGCTVADDFTKQLGVEAEPMLAAALKHRSDGKCPAPPAPPSAPSSSIDVIASSDGMSSQRFPMSEIKLPDDPFYDDEIIFE